MGTGWKKFDSPRFLKFSPEPAKIFWNKIKVFVKASICDVMMVESLLGEWGSTLPKVMGENTKSPSQDFIDFAIKTH